MPKIRIGPWGLLLAVAWCSTVSARPQYLDVWVSRYPTSTLPARMEAMAGFSCYVCHHPAILAQPGNCYREDLILLLDSGMDIGPAIEALDGEDSDLDGFANGQEATMARADLPGEVGYNPGLIGDTGTDPCADDPNDVVTGVPETPPDAIPAVSEWGLVAMGILSVVAGAFVLSRRQREAAA